MRFNLIFIMTLFLFSSHAFSAIDFDNIDDRILIADTNDLSFADGSDDSPFSVSAWINMDDATVFYIISKRDLISEDEWSFDVTGGDDLRFVLSDESANGVIRVRTTTALTPLENIWIHVAGTYDGSEASSGMTLYVNGAAVANDNLDGTYTAMENTSSRIGIGNSPSYSLYADGEIDDARVYDVELTATDIAVLYANGRTTRRGGPKRGNLVGYWPIDDGQPGTMADMDNVRDESGKGNDGTATDGGNDMGLTWTHNPQINYPVLAKY